MRGVALAHGVLHPQESEPPDAQGMQTPVPVKAVGTDVVGGQEGGMSFATGGQWTQLSKVTEATKAETCSGKGK